ncbi:MAG: hypothetical protein AAB448_01335 [Patescibacteria group bacterium]
MSESQRKIIAYIILAVCCSIIEVLGLTTRFRERLAEPCPVDIVCPPLPSEVVTMIGSFDVEISREQFDSYRIQLIAIAIIAELACVFMFVKTLREQEMQRKRDSSVGMGTPSE